MCAVLMGNSSQVLIKKKKKTLISFVTLSPLIYIFIHQKLGKLSDCTYKVAKSQNLCLAMLKCFHINKCLSLKHLHTLCAMNYRVWSLLNLSAQSSKLFLSIADGFSLLKATASCRQWLTTALQDRQRYHVCPWGGKFIHFLLDFAC